MSKIVTNVMDLVAYQLDLIHGKVSAELHKVSVAVKNKQLDLISLEKRKMELEWELLEIEKKITKHIIGVHVPDVQEK